MVATTIVSQLNIIIFHGKAGKHRMDGNLANIEVVYNIDLVLESQNIALDNTF